MNKKWLAAVAAVAAIALFMTGCSRSRQGSSTVLSGEAQGFGGPVSVQLTLSGDKITALEITGDGETPNIGGTAIEALTESILAAGSIEGIDAISGATITSNAVFNAIRQAISSAPGSAAFSGSGSEIHATAVTHGLGFAPIGRIENGVDDRGAGFYSFNVVMAYGLFDSDGSILDLEVDVLEVATPNHHQGRSPTLPHLTGFPSQSYNTDDNRDGTVDSVTEQTYDAYVTQVESWLTKRERGSGYRVGSGAIWADEMDIYEEAFKGMTVAELQQLFASSFSDINGRPLSPDSSNEADVAKYSALSDADKAALDAVSGATISLNDSHGDIVGAIAKAYENRRPVDAVHIASIGLSNTNSGTVGYGTDTQGVSNYSFNIQATGAVYGDDGRMLAVYTDVLQVSTPNAHGPALTGFPGQSYSNGNATAEQTEETFLQQVAAWQTKRELGSSYMMPSGSWADQMDIFDEFFTGMTAEEMNAWFATHFSDIDGKVLSASSSNEADVAKYNALSDEQKAALDALSGASMSLRNDYGDLLGTIEKAWANAKPTNITVLN